MYYQGETFWWEQIIAYCIVGLLAYIIDKINHRKQNKKIEE